MQIRRLLSGMVCAQDGQLHIGDRLVSVNGVSLKGVTHSMALQLLKKPMELVTFVILREGLQTQGKSLNAASESKSDSVIEASAVPDVSNVRNKSKMDRGIHNSSKSEDSSIRSEPLEPTKIVNILKSQSVLESQENNESTKVDKLGDDEDGTILEQPPELPCSPPPPPLVDAEDVLDGGLSIPSLPPSFSPPPPPPSAEATSPSEDDLQMSSFRIVSPPPDLSPRMKRFIEQDLFKTENYEESSSQESAHLGEILPESSSSLNQANFPDGWDLQSLPKSDDLSVHGKGDFFTSEQSDITETFELMSTDSLIVPPPTLPQNEIVEKNNTAKRTEPSSLLPVVDKTSSPSLAVGVNDDLSSGESTNKTSKDENKALEMRRPNGDNTSSISTSDDSKEQEKEDDVKPVEGRRVENVPFVITYQKKFRSLGMKVDLSGEGKVGVTEVSSFGLVGKDGNIRYDMQTESIGRVVFSWNTTVCVNRKDCYFPLALLLPCFNQIKVGGLVSKETVVLRRWGR